MIKFKKALEELLYYKVNKNVALDIVKKFSFERIENNIQYIITTYPKKDKKKEYPKLIVTAIKKILLVSLGDYKVLMMIKLKKIKKNQKRVQKNMMTSLKKLKLMKKQKK